MKKNDQIDLYKTVIKIEILILRNNWKNLSLIKLKK